MPPLLSVLMSNLPSAVVLRWEISRLQRDRPESYAHCGHQRGFRQQAAGPRLPRGQGLAGSGGGAHLHDILPSGVIVLAQVATDIPFLIVGVGPGAIFLENDAALVVGADVERRGCGRGNDGLHQEQHPDSERPGHAGPGQSGAVSPIWRVRPLPRIWGPVVAAASVARIMNRVL